LTPVFMYSPGLFPPPVVTSDSYNMVGQIKQAHAYFQIGPLVQICSDFSKKMHSRPD
jgi:hypothetical protein